MTTTSDPAADPAALDALAAEAAAADTPPAAPESPPPEAATLPAGLSVDALRLAFGVALKRWPSLAMTADETDALAQAWHAPVNDLYGKLLRWLGQDPAALGPWANAVTVTAAVFLPRILAKFYAQADAAAETPPAQ